MHFKIHPEVRATFGDDDGSVLMNVQSGVVFSLNGVGAKIWAKMQEGQRFEAILDFLAQEYKVPKEQLSSDLETFVRELVRKGLVHEVEATRGFCKAKGGVK